MNEHFTRKEKDQMSKLASAIMQNRSDAWKQQKAEEYGNAMESKEEG